MTITDEPRAAAKPGVIQRVRRGGAGEAFSSWWRRLPRAGKWVAALLTFGVAVLLPYIPQVPVLSTIFNTPGSDFASVLFYPVGCYVLVAIGLNIVVGQAGLLDLGYVAFFAIGAYTSAVLGSAHGSLPWVATVPIAIAIAMTAGLLLGLPTLRLRGDYLAIVTLGFGEIIRITANNSNWVDGPRGIQNIPKPPSWLGLHFGIEDAKPYYWLILCAIVLVILVYKALEHSRVGRAWVAIREDEDAAELMGVPTFKFKLWAFAMGAAIGGFSGTFYASFAGSITPDTFTLILSILFLCCVVLGGSGNLAGAIVGAIVIGYLPERFRGFSEYRVLVFGAALVVMMIFRPEGLVPNRRRAAEMEDRREEAEVG
jgi:branched-chain amino acid transport system permease protein